MSLPPPQICRTCEHIVVRPDRDGVARIRQDGMYACDFPAPEIVVPKSIRLSFDRTRVWPQMTGCPVWVSRKKKPKSRPENI